MNYKLMHVIPLADSRDHNESDDCWCHPSVEDAEGSKIVIHNSADMREEYEKATGEAVPGKPWICIKDEVPMELDR